MAVSIFNGIKQWEYKWKGRDIKLPIFFHENTIISVAYTASTKEVKKLLPIDSMHPIELWPGRCLFAIAAVEYRKSDLGAYNEVVIAFPVTYKRRQIPFFTALNQLITNSFSSYVWQLPVSAEFPRKGGAELFGYPKFIADINFNRSNGWVSCEVSEKGESILKFSGKVLPTKKGRNGKYLCYTMLDGIPLSINSYQNNLEYAESRDKEDAVLEWGGNHPIGQTIKNLKLSKKPIAYQYSPLNELVLFPMRNLLDD